MLRSHISNKQNILQITTIYIASTQNKLDLQVDDC